eukprot:scaffold246011_cov21-Tisochrysis_lutea.AAC.3
MRPAPAWSFEHAALHKPSQTSCKRAAHRPAPRSRGKGKGHEAEPANEGSYSAAIKQANTESKDTERLDHSTSATQL